MDGNYARGNNITIKKSNYSATAAGNKDLEILGESENDVVVDSTGPYQSYILIF